jgi:hypothetical protein
MMRIFVPKRDGLVAILLALGFLCGALGYTYWGGWREGRTGAAAPMPNLPDLQVPEAVVLKEITGLRTRLNRLAYPRAAAQQGVALGLFGYTPAATNLRQGRGGRHGLAQRSVQFDYTLSFALSAGSQQLCLLDGKLYTRGGRLPDGGRILTIEPERVLVEKSPLRRWIYLQASPPGGELPAETRAPSATSSTSSTSSTSALALPPNEEG